MRGQHIENFLATIALLLFAGAAAAQSDAPPPLQIGGITFSGMVRERYEVWDWFQPAKGENFYGYSGTVIRFGLSQKRDNFDWNVEFEAPILLGLPNGAVLAAPSGQLGLAPPISPPTTKRKTPPSSFPSKPTFASTATTSSMQIGRFEYFDGAEVKPADATLASLKNDRINQRLIGNFGFFRRHAQFRRLALRLLQRPMEFHRAKRHCRPRRLPGRWLGLGQHAHHLRRTHPRSRPRRIALRMAPLWHLLPRRSRPGGKPTIVPHPSKPSISPASTSAPTADISSWPRPPRGGTFDLLGWGAFQTGSWGVQKQRSAAGSIEAGFQPHFWSAVRPWFRGGFDYTSGDGNPNDNTHGTFFAVLPRLASTRASRSSIPWT